MVPQEVAAVTTGLREQQDQGDVRAWLKGLGQPMDSGRRKRSFERMDRMERLTSCQCLEKDDLGDWGRVKVDCSVHDRSLCDMHSTTFPSSCFGSVLLYLIKRVFSSDPVADKTVTLQMCVFLRTAFSVSGNGRTT